MKHDHNVSPSTQLQRFSEVEALIVGDVMLDEYVMGTVNRLSPEAPVPVLRRLDDRYVGGGAANVALNIAALGGRVHLIGVVGDDAEGRRLTALTAKAGVSTTLVVDKSRPTITKTRVLVGAHQIVRIDRENDGPLRGELEDELVARALDLMNTADVVILSDYAKGVLTDRVLSEIIALGQARCKPVLVDPKRRDFSAYRGASVIKPNRGELSIATGLPCGTDGEARSAAKQIVKATGAAVLLTRSEQGVAFFGVDGGEHLLATEAAEVFDVSGAGDTVIAAFALATALEAPPAQALRIANAAAGVVVSKAGTATLSIDELRAALEERDGAGSEIKGRLLSWDEAVRQREAWRERGLSVGFTNGCFDLIHPGHIALLRGAASRCDRLVVALNTDASVSRLKGPARPVQAEQARAEIMGALDPVDMVVLFGQATPLELITALKPDVLIKGADYAVADIVGSEEVLASGGRVETVDLRTGHSTTNLIARANS